MTSNVGKLEEEALKRKERLKALRGKPQETGGDEPVEKKRADEPSVLPRPVFRSYQPQDDELKELQMPKAKPVEVIDKVQDQLESAIPESLVDEVDLVKLAPRKPDWDLKRDIAKKLEKLERRTQRAIAELIRQRLESGGEEDLAAVVNIAAAADSRTK